MTKEYRIAARAAIKELDLDMVYPIEKSRYGMYICPICGSGTGNHRTGALKIYRDSHRVRCYANNCFDSRGEDTLGALKRITGLSETEVLQQYLPHQYQQKQRSYKSYE